MNYYAFVFMLVIEMFIYLNMPIVFVAGFNKECASIYTHRIDHILAQSSTSEQLVKKSGNKKGQRKINPNLVRIFESYEPVIGIEGPHPSYYVSVYFYIFPFSLLKSIVN